MKIVLALFAVVVMQTSSAEGGHCGTCKNGTPVCRYYGYKWYLKSCTCNNCYENPPHNKKICVPKSCDKNCNCGECKCNPRDGTEYCQCKTNFKGTNCDTGPCDKGKNPCQNSGTCSVRLQPHCDASCSCPSCYYGPYCRKKKCDSVNCGRCGDCVCKDGKTSCICKGGYTGEHCEISPCDGDNNPCQNSGTCSVLPKPHCGASCSCPCYSQPFCKTSKCASVDCGTCGDCVCKNGVTSCKCKGDYTGDKCDKSPCSGKNPCNSTYRQKYVCTVKDCSRDCKPIHRY